jgi:hypothetical protein
MSRPRCVRRMICRLRSRRDLQRALRASENGASVGAALQGLRAYALNIGTMARMAIAKVALHDHWLTKADIVAPKRNRHLFAPSQSARNSCSAFT